jgi:hypothetical protein
MDEYLYTACACEICDTAGPEPDVELAAYLNAVLTDVNRIQPALDMDPGPVRSYR